MLFVCLQIGIHKNKYVSDKNVRKDTHNNERFQSSRVELNVCWVDIHGKWHRKE